ncbi:MAG: MBL fold metallo-hydrolase [Gemmatimonadota bacterium]|nr:MBL fold metallo-hydrolase [Gemmatimonadota bacterium]
MSKTLGRRAVLGTALGLFLIPAGDVDAQREIREQRIGDAFTVLSPDEGSGNTIVFRGTDGTFLVDTMADSISTDLLAALDGLGVDDVRYIANTHWHQNHLGGNDDLSPTAVVIGPATLRARLQTDQTLEFLVDQTFPALPEPFWPSVTYDDAVALHFNDERIEIVHVRAHTDSDAIVVWPESRVAATGDLWTPTGWMVPDIDTGGSLAGVATALTTLLERLPADAVIVPGHGRPGTRDELARYVSVVQATVDYVRLAMDAGRDLRQIIDEAPPDVTDPLGAAAPRMLEAAYRGGG